MVSELDVVSIPRSAQAMTELAAAEAELQKVVDEVIYSALRPAHLAYYIYFALIVCASSAKCERQAPPRAMDV